jgi:hypothetical protein
MAHKREEVLGAEHWLQLTPISGVSYYRWFALSSWNQLSTIIN